MAGYVALGAFGAAATIALRFRLYLELAIRAFPDLPIADSQVPDEFQAS